MGICSDKVEDEVKVALLSNGDKSSSTDKYNTDSDNTTQVPKHIS